MKYEQSREYRPFSNRKPQFLLLLKLIVVFSSACTNIDHSPTHPKKGLLADVPPNTKRVSFKVSEATSFSADVSKATGEIVIDVLGDLYSLPRGGGQAHLLFSTPAWNFGARYSPDGSMVAFLTEFSTHQTLLSTKRFDEGEKQILFHDANGSVNWSKDGKYLVTTNSAGHIVSLLSTGGMAPHDFSPLIQASIVAQHPSFSSDSSSIYFVGRWRSTEPQKIMRFDLVTGALTVVSDYQGGSLSFPIVSDNDEWLAFVAIEYTDSGPIREVRLRHLPSGVEKSVGRSFKWGTPTSFAFSTDTESVILASSGKLVRVDIESDKVFPIPFEVKIDKNIPKSIEVDRPIQDDDIRVRHLRWLSTADGGATIAFSALGRIWLADASTSDVVRLSRVEDRSEYAPALSPDGHRIAFVTWSDKELGNLIILPLNDTANERKLLTPGLYTNPVWSPDGTRIAYLAAHSGEETQHFVYGHRPRQKMAIRILNLLTGEESEVANVVAPTSALNRYYPPIFFSEDGTRLIFTQSEVNSGQVERELVSRRLDGTDHQVHIQLDNKVDHISVSPSEEALAVIQRNDLWLAQLPAKLTSSSTPYQLRGDLALTRLSDGGVSYVSWIDEWTLAWSFTNRVFAADTRNPRPRLLSKIELIVPRALQYQNYVLANAQIITMNDRNDFVSGSILIKQSRIAAIGKLEELPVTDEIPIFDMAGLYVAPGLFDSHTHMHQLIHGGVEISARIKREYISNLSNGITTIFDPAASTISVFSQAEMIDAGIMLGPRVFSTGDIVDPDIKGRNYVPTYLDHVARATVGRLVSSGALMIKSYGQRFAEGRKSLLEAGREWNIPIIGHGDTSIIGDAQLVLEGFSVVEHMPRGSPMYDDFIGLYARSGVYITPTLFASARSQRGSVFNEYLGRQSGNKKYLMFAALGPTRTLERIRRITNGDTIHIGGVFLDRTIEDLISIIREGGNVSLGSHSGDGAALHWEMELLADHGLSPLEAIRLSTIAGAEKLGVTADLGSVEAGKLADLIVLNCNPLENIRCTSDIEYVVKNGFVYHADSMTQMWPEYKPLPRLWWHSDKDWEELKPELPEPWKDVPIAEGVKLEYSTLH